MITNRLIETLIMFASNIYIYIYKYKLMLFQKKVISETN